MNRELREKIAPWSAWLGVILLVAALVDSSIKKGPTWLPVVLLSAGVVLILLYALLRPDEVRKVLTGRSARYGSNAVVLSVAVLGILFFLDVLGIKYHKRFDLTQNKQYTLSQETIQIIQNLKEPVEIIGFFSENDSRRDNIGGLLDEYVYHSHGKVKYRFVDPDTNPALARKYKISSYGILVFIRGKKTQQSYAMDEQDITSGILKVSREKPLVVYFTTGHQERGPEEFNQKGYSTITRLLGKDNYEVKTLNLATVTGTLPSNMAALVVASPLKPFAPKEEKKLRDYLDKGGKLMIMTDPQAPIPISDTLKNEWGITFDNDVVIDPSNSFFGDVASPAVSQYRFHSITKDLNGLMSFFPLARSITITRTNYPTITVDSLVDTSKRSWGETDLTNSHAHFDKGKDLPGPLVLAAAGTNKNTKARLVVFGDSDFVSNGVLGAVQGAFGNPDLFRNSVNWLTEEKSLIAIGPKPPAIHSIRPITGAEQKLLLYTLVIFLPVIVLLAGALVWVRRR